MSTPKTETIRRYCSNALAISILHERGLLTDDEAADLRARDKEASDAFYARIYGEGAVDMFDLWNRESVERITKKG